MPSTLDPYLKAAGRALMALLFIWFGFAKIPGYAGSQGYMEKFGVPGELLPLVILTEIGGGLAILAGWQTRYASIALAGFCVLAAVIFHNNVGDRVQLIFFLKNFALAGGFLILAAAGPGAWSLDGRKG